MIVTCPTCLRTHDIETPVRCYCGVPLYLPPPICTRGDGPPLPPGWPNVPAERKNDD